MREYNTWSNSTYFLTVWYNLVCMKTIFYTVTTDWAVELKCHSRVSRVWSLNVAQPLNLSLNKITNEVKHSFITGHWWWTHWDRDGCSLHKTFTVLCLGQTVTHVTTSTCWIRLRMTETKCTRPVPECTPSSWCTPVQSWVYTCTHITIRYV